MHREHKFINAILEKRILLEISNVGNLDTDIWKRIFFQISNVGIHVDIFAKQSYPLRIISSSILHDGELTKKNPLLILDQRNVAT
jgi:hypothetical protein